MKTKTHVPELLGHSKGSIKRKTDSYECLHKKKKKPKQNREILINSLIMYFSLLEKQEQNKSKISNGKK
jgi:hypothetical protein